MGSRCRISFILMLFALTGINDGFHLFHSNGDRLCLYADYVVHGQAWALVPYCFQVDSASMDPTCQDHGQHLSFHQLHEKNISTNDLFHWHVPIEVIDAYGQFRDSPDQDAYFCNCSDLQWFGLSCEYTFESPTLTFETIIEDQFRFRQTYQQSKRLISPRYRGLNCTLYGFDLDWRQICNGLIDCEDGEDEFYCYELESNECDPEKEFRCKSGHCIDKRFAYDLVFDCLDHSDEVQVEPWNRCGLLSSTDCDEYQCGSMNYLFPCGDGECSTSQTCFNGRNTQLIPSSNNESHCHACLHCHLRSVAPITQTPSAISIDCAQFLNDWRCNATFCSDLFLTDRALMYPDVRLFYRSARQILPDLICYDSRRCQFYPPTVNQSGLTCRTRQAFPSLSSALSFADFHVILQRLFSACTLHRSLNGSTLYPCPNSDQLISYHRLNDGFKDCSQSNADEMFVDLCRFNFSEQFSCLTSNDCLRREYLYNGKSAPNCLDESNRVFPLTCSHRDDLGCEHRRGETIPIDYFLFQELCNNQIHPDLIDDETNCDQWQSVCNLKYRQCDGIVNCRDQRDENNCQSSFGCLRDEINIHCLRYPDPKASRNTCLLRERIDDGRIDCYGSVDEDVDYCARNYPNEITRRFHCYNHSECIPLENLCDGIVDCPARDDEEICPNRLISTKCPSGVYFCNNPLKPSSCQSKKIRCDGEITCYDGDHRSSIVYHDERFCHLISKRIQYKNFPWNDHHQYPPEAIVIHQAQQIVASPFTGPSPRITDRTVPSLDLYHCYRGVVVKSSIDRQLHCLCPPAYEGPLCQYQTEHITVIYSIRMKENEYQPLRTYRLLIRLQTSTNFAYDAMEMIYSPAFNKSLIYKHIVYLKAPALHQSYSIVVDIFQITRSTVQYVSSWIYPIPFAFLPVQRLAREIFLNDGTKSNDRCLKNCSEHGQCRIYANTPNETYCFCSAGWTGEFCQVKSSIHRCSSSALHYHSFCVCPLTKLGRSCHVSEDLCSREKLCLNGGTCLPTDPRRGGFVCQCPRGFYGYYCHHRSAKIEIQLKNLWINQRHEREIPLVMVQLANISNQIGLAKILHRDLFRNVPMDSSLVVFSEQMNLPTFALVQTYFESDTREDFYLVALLKRSFRQLTTSILPSNRCPRIEEFLNQTILSLPYLERAKFYYLPCLTLGTRCFYDEHYLCLCDQQAYLDCIYLNHSQSHCPSKAKEKRCLNDGRCYQSMDFQSHCVCPRCYFGDQCQFTLLKYSISFDALLDEEIISERRFFQQNSLIIGTTVTVFVIVLIGLISNGASIITFAQVQPRAFGCGWYLFASCLISELGLVVFAGRFAYLLITRLTPIDPSYDRILTIFCVALEYLLSILPPMIDWLIACVSIERTWIARQGIRFDRQRSVFLAKRMIGAIIVSISLLGLHQCLYRRVIHDVEHRQSWCVNQYPSPWLNHYELVINLIHLAVPFLLHLSSLLMLIMSLIRRKVSVSVRTKAKSLIELIKEQVQLHKIVLCTPFLLILLHLPRLISSFLFSCSKSSWTKSFLLASYFFSSLPMGLTLFIFILPKSSYRKELRRWFYHRQRLN